MVWYLTPDQALIHRSDSSTNSKKDADDDNDNNSRENPSYDFSIGKIQSIQNKPDLSKPNSTFCSICNRSDRIVTDPESGEIICSICGMVLSDKVEDTSHLERHIFSKGGQIDETNARTGAPTSLARHDMGLATIIGRRDRDASGQKIDSSINSTMQRLRAWDFRIHLSRSSDRNLNTAFKLLNTLKDRLGLSDAIVEKVAYIYRKAQERGFVRGRTISSVLAAAVYITCRDLEVPKTMKDIAAASNLKRKDIARTYRQLILELDYKVPNPDPIKCIAKVPMGLAATVLYISCIKAGENISQKDISSAAGVTEVTLRNRFKDLRDHLTDLN